MSNHVNSLPPLQGEGRGEVIRSRVMRFGIMCNGAVFQQWQADAILELKKHGHQPVLLIIDARPDQKHSLVSRFMRRKWGTLLYTFLENRSFKPAAKKPVGLQRELAGVGSLSCKVEKRGYSEYFPADDVASIRNHGLDFILRFGFNIIRGEILHTARFGVWSFHHDDEMKYRGGPAGFWEIFRGDPVNGAILQQLTGKLDSGIILKKGYLKTIMHSFRGNLEQLLTVSSSWPALVADELCMKSAGADLTDVCYIKPESNTNAPLFKVPGNLQMLKFLFLLFRNRILFQYRDLMAAENWNVGLIMKPIHEVALGNEKLREADVMWLPAVTYSDYLADPAGFQEQGKLHILVEDFSYPSQKAGISEIILDLDPVGVIHPDGIRNPVRVLDSQNHLSYPYTFEYQGVVYCLPESHQSGNITLYRRVPATGRFTIERILLNNVAAIDPTLLFYNGLWWLFFTGRKYSNTHLFLYYSKELTGDFEPHHLNPVKTDIRSARPAGTPFIHDGVLYRPAQDCSATYGGRVAINRVLILTPDDFAEETINFIEPIRGSKYDRGLHTLFSVGNYTLIDGKRYQFNRHFFYHQIRNKMHRKDPGNV